VAWYGRCEQGRRAGGGDLRVGALDGEGSDLGKAGLLLGPDDRGVEQHAGIALLPQLHRLGPVLAGMGETERGQRGGHLGTGHAVDGELGEGGPVQCRRGLRSVAAAQSLLEHQK
jgi:hypothetical protein